MSTIIHPRLKNALAKFFPLACALQEPMKTQDSSGEENITFATHAGYEAIPCRVGAAGGGQRRGNEQTYLEATHRITLAGSYPDVREQWTAVVDGVRYDILYVARSTEDVTTRLECRIVR